mmetsp:Transcript_626/g.2251  ORF Transcript_626/g.2251 Transcript_626/m.2251 type:complete len:237 (-) Transcript_626:2213-2923(-)
MTKTINTSARTLVFFLTKERKSRQRCAGVAAWDAAPRLRKEPPLRERGARLALPPPPAASLAAAADSGAGAGAGTGAGASFSASLRRRTSAASCSARESAVVFPCTMALKGPSESSALCARTRTRCIAPGWRPWRRHSVAAPAYTSLNSPEPSTSAASTRYSRAPGTASHRAARAPGSLVPAASSPAGAASGGCGTVNTHGALHAPAPTALCARTRSEYRDPGSRPFVWNVCAGPS